MLKRNKFAVVLLGASFVLASCGGGGTSSKVSSSSSSTPASSSSTQESEKVTVTFKNGDTVLKTEEIAQGGTATSYTPTLAGKDFVDWYLTPSFSRLFDFSTKIEENLTLYAAFSVYTADPSVYYLAGSGKSPLLSVSNWGKVANDDLKFTLNDVSANAVKKNIYTITADLYVDDQFQITALSGTPLAWGRQFGYGYIANLKSVSEFISSSDGLSDSNRKKNIQVAKDGNYTITLTTYPDHDNDSEENAAAKINNVDRIDIVRNGEILVPKKEFETNFYLKGEKVTLWGDIRNSSTKMTLNAEKTAYELTRYLAAEDQFLFVSTLTDLESGEVTDGNEYIKFPNLDTESQAYFSNSNGNIKTLADGEYVFSYGVASKVLSVTFDDDKELTVGQYFVNGKIGAHNWDTVFTADFKLAPVDGVANTFVSSGIVMAADDEFTLAGFKSDATEPGDKWVNSIGNYNYSNMVAASDKNANANFEAKDQYNNIKVKTAGTYTLTFDAYSETIVMKAAA